MIASLVENLPKIALFLFIVGIAVFIGYLTRRYVISYVSRVAEQTKTAVDNIIVESMKTPIMFWFVLVGGYLGTKVLELPPTLLDYIGKGLLVLLVFSITLTLSYIANGLIRHYGLRLGAAITTTGLIQNLARFVILLIGFMILLSILGIEITPILASFGIAALAIALALQDTLANIFSGLHLLADKPIKVGDFVQIEGGYEGYVVDIGWRTTRIRTRDNTVITIPNKKVAESIIHNYDMPRRLTRVRIDVGVSYDSDPDKVEKTLLDIIEQASKRIKDIVLNPQPTVRFLEFGDFALKFQLRFYVRRYADRRAIIHEVNKMILRRFREEGIEIPFPIRTLYVKH